MNNVVVTGANRGIGLELVKTYLARGENVYALCRSKSDELANTDAVIIDGIDVTDDNLAAKLRDALRDVEINILINNAGALVDDTLGEIDYSGVIWQFEVNAVGPLRITEALLDNMKTGSKIGMITSRMGSMSDNTSGGHYGYRMSKAALNAAGVSLARDLNRRGIAVAMLHPGFVQTRMVEFNGDIGPEVAAERLAKRLAELNLTNSGTFWHSKGDVLPW